MSIIRVETRPLGADVPLIDRKAIEAIVARTMPWLPPSLQRGILQAVKTCVRTVLETMCETARKRRGDTDADTIDVYNRLSAVVYALRDVIDAMDR